tara:strand:- start:4964 stop:6319 length:1356 start_codon:yes stop_codon:yes gene_type:complete
MPALTIGLSSYERAEGDIPELPVVNMYVEETPSEGIALQSRPSLADRSADMGAGPIEALFKRDLVIGSALHGVSGGKLYQETTEIGSITGSGFTSMAGNEIGLMTTAGEDLHFFNGTTLSTVAFPDAAYVVHVSVGGSRYWMVRKDTGKLYFTDALEADVEGLDFLTAESMPDRLLQTLWIDGALIGFGSESIEFFQPTGNNELPIVPLTNMVIEKGIKATGCAIGIGSTFACVTNENTVILQNENNVISNPGLHARIEASADVRLFRILIDGTQMLALRIDGETQIYNPRTGRWSEFATYGLSNWGVKCAEGPIMGSAVDGKTLTWGEDHTDALATNELFERRWRAGMPINASGVNVSNLMVRANVGQTPYLTGDYTDPVLEMRLSRDAGQTWGSFKSASLGAQGEYRKKVEWRALGMASRPAFFAEFRCTDPVPLRVSEVLINEPFGGR